MAAEQGSTGRTGRERLNPPGVHTPQANYSLVSRVGNTLYVSGWAGSGARSTSRSSGAPAGSSFC